MGTSSRRNGQTARARGEDCLLLGQAVTLAVMLGLIGAAYVWSM